MSDGRPRRVGMMRTNGPKGYLIGHVKRPAGEEGLWKSRTSRDLSDVIDFVQLNPAGIRLSQELTLNSLNGRVKSLEEKVEFLMELLESPNQAPVDPIARWINANRQELEKFKGKRVAIHPEKGIVASAENLKVLSQIVRELGLSGQVVFDIVGED